MIAVARGHPMHRIARHPVDFVRPSVEALLDPLRPKPRRQEFNNLILMACHGR
jgi:hypothetical protein